MGSLPKTVRPPTTKRQKMSTTWDNRIKFLVRYMYDLDNNGHLNARDFECLAVKFTILEGRGQWNKANFNRFSKIMTNLWNEISDTADLNRDGAVSLSELQVALRVLCLGKDFDDMPSAFRQFITAMFNTIDADGDGFIGLEEYRYDCINRQPVGSIDEIDRCFEKISTNGGVTRAQYENMFAKYLGSQDSKAKFCHLFGPLPLLK